MIKVTDRFYINANTNCYTLQEKTKVQDENSKNYGQEVFKDIGYYTTLEQCLKGILKASTREYVGGDREKSIHELIGFIKGQNDIIESSKLDI